jgi:ATP-dependent helicase/nuclease subunit A
MTRDAASAAQLAAADPAASTWLTANAGSGKTRVLTDRVARLLLDGADPQRILCLTFTKAAAAEMQDRLFRRLGAWAMLEDDALRAALEELGLPAEAARSATRRAEARRLFARALETPGGLRVQTIHAFSAGLLRRFPLEAGVSPRFAEMDDRAARLLRDSVLEAVADGPDAPVVAAVARQFTGTSLADLAEKVVAARAKLTWPLDRAGALALFGLDPDLSEAGLVAEVLPQGTTALMADVAAIMAKGKETDAAVADCLVAAAAMPRTLRLLEVLERRLLYRAKAEVPFGARADKIPTKDTRRLLGSLQEPFVDLMRRVEAARPRRLALQAALQTEALEAFASVLLRDYAAAKAARGWLDFDDLIARANGLLSDPAVAQWVLFRLDGGIDHMLVDEAQDTSPDQWQLIAALAQEFTAGQGARDTSRTLFVVGDRKQSIYSFQGASLETFERMRAAFSRRLAGAGTPLAERALEHSFRSSPAILRLVDHTFTGDAALGGPVRHLAFHTDMPGRVDLWPAPSSEKDDDDDDWSRPEDRAAPADPQAELAERMAAAIEGMIARGEQVTVKGITRPVTAGDVLILVQRRSGVFHPIIRACKAAGLPVAGADRLRLGGELAVRDLVALLSFLATPEDDLSLAAVLRSPLCGWSEDALFRLAQGRSGHLWPALRDQSEHYPETLALLRDLRDRADFLRPYELLDRVLTRHDGRQRLVARLGDEAEDGIDALLDQALAHERSEVPSLTGFLAWMAAAEVDVKRELEQAGARIRVMTVHGAKGLEAPIVILPDTADRRPREDGPVLALDGGRAVWQPHAEDMPGLVSAARAAARARAAAERLRLLYVAMTRAQSWLIVGAAGRTAQPDCWYNLVAAGMRAAGAEALADGGLRLSHGAWPAPHPGAPAVVPARPALPGWALRPPPDRPRPPQALSPSDLGGAKVMPAEMAPELEAASLRRGSLLHLLLDHLPQHAPADRGEVGLALLARADAPATGAETAMLVAQARAILAMPALAPAFAPGLTEVAVTGRIGGRLFRGNIDRLVFEAEAVTVVDFKSNRVLPPSPAAVPEGILRQMGAYLALVEPLYPGRRVGAGILWTEGPVWMPLPRDLVMAALQRVAFP